MTKEVPDKAVLDTIMSAAVDAIVVADAQGVIARANLAASKMFGYSDGEMIGENVKMLMVQPMAKLHDSFMADHVRTGKQRIIGVGRDVEGQRKDGSVFPLHLSVGRAKEQEEPLFVAILRDLTRERAIQNATSRSQRLEAIGQMTGGISHDFNNLLTVIIGNLELLQNRQADDAQVALIRDALEAAELGSSLTSGLMVFARKSNLAPIQIDVRETCRAALAILRRTLGAKYKIRTEFAAQISTVLADPAQLQSALINLALNARDAMPDGGELLFSIANITIDDDYMAQEIDVSAGTYVQISVSDNGQGMTPDAQRRAFEPFFTTKTEGNGTGLGLAMVYGFVRQSGGHITLYSELGLGTSIGLYFPAVEDGDSLASLSAPSGDVQTFGKGQTVLVVEDNPKVRRLSVRRVQVLGFRTLEASTADEALAMLSRGNRVDVLFSDLVMPGKLNGFELAAKVRSTHPQIKILLTSGYASDVVTGAMPHQEPFEILHKPFRHADLATRLRQLLAIGSG